MRFKNTITGNTLVTNDEKAIRAMQSSPQYVEVDEYAAVKVVKAPEPAPKKAEPKKKQPPKKKAETTK